MAATRASGSLTRRERLAYVFLAALAASALLICAGLGWAAVPRERRVRLGTVEEFPEGKPAHFALAEYPPVYGVRLAGTPVAWDARAPVEGRSTRCRFVWVPTNNRFEDPCSGNKWCLDGTIADNRYGPSRTLDRYALIVDPDGQVWLRPDRVVLGSPQPGAHAVHTSTASSPYLCDHLRR